MTRRCDWRIRDLVEGAAPATLYLVVPPSDISRTKPLVRLILNQIGRRLTEELDAEAPPASAAADARRVSGARPARLLRERARLHGGLRPEELPDRAVAEPDREGLRPEQLDPRQLPCPRELRDQRRAHGQARVRRPRHGDRNARDEELCRASAEPLARPSDGLAPGDGAAAADARRGHAASPGRRAGPGLRLPSDPREEGALLRGCGDEGAHPPAADSVRLAMSDPVRNGSRPHLQGDWSDAVVATPTAAPVEDPANAGIRREPELPEHEEIAPEPRKAGPRVRADGGRAGRRGAAPARDAADLGERARARSPSIRPTTWGCERCMRTKHTFRLPPDLAGKLADYAARKGVPQALVVEAALASHLSPDGADRLEARAGTPARSHDAADGAARTARRHFERGAGGVRALLADQHAAIAGRRTAGRADQRAGALRRFRRGARPAPRARAQTCRRDRPRRRCSRGGSRIRTAERPDRPTIPAACLSIRQTLRLVQPCCIAPFPALSNQPR